MENISGFLCIGTFALAILLSLILIYALFFADGTKRKDIQTAAVNYASSLQQLKKFPDNADLRQKTLSLGRKYARIAREGGKETLFDEMALMNDINAVIGRPTGKQQKSALERLNELEKLKEKGLISEDEYRTKRSSILDEM